MPFTPEAIPYPWPTNVAVTGRQHQREATSALRPVLQARSRITIGKLAGKDPMEYQRPQPSGLAQ